MDDIEYTAFGRRPRDASPGAHRFPDARTLGRRLFLLRARFGLSVADVADAAGIRHSIVHEFEEFGAVSAESLLWLMEVVSGGESIVDAFVFPNFGDRAEFVTRGRIALVTRI